MFHQHMREHHHLHILGVHQYREGKQRCPKESYPKIYYYIFWDNWMSAYRSQMLLILHKCKIRLIPGKQEQHHQHRLACCHHCREILWQVMNHQHRHRWVWCCLHMGWDGDGQSHHHWHMYKLVCLHQHTWASVCQQVHQVFLAYLLQILLVFGLRQPR